MSEHTVVLLEKLTTLAMRMRRLLEGSRICVFEADNRYKLYNTLNKVGKDVTLVILDLDVEKDYAMALLQATRKRLLHTPIIVLTPGRGRDFFVEAMLLGATDFIIKPFGDDVFLSRVFKYLYRGQDEAAETVTSDLGRYLKGELRKAEKGKFPLSVMILCVARASEEEETAGSDNTAVSAFVYENLKDLFWETDIFIRFASKYYLGIFPFCDETNRKIVENKVHAGFERLKKDNAMLEGHDLMCVFVTYPFDTGDAGKVYGLLLQRVREQLNGEIRVALQM